jgi:hypothetical protein
MIEKCEICGMDLAEIEVVKLPDNINGGYINKITHHCPTLNVPETFTHFAVVRLEGKEPYFKLFAYYPYLIHDYRDGKQLLVYKKDVNIPGGYIEICLLEALDLRGMPWSDTEKMKSKLQLYTIFS